MCLHTFNNIKRCSVWPVIVFSTAVRWRDTASVGYFGKDVFQPAPIVLEAMNVYKRFFTYAYITLRGRFYVRMSTVSWYRCFLVFYAWAGNF